MLISLLVLSISGCGNIAVPDSAVTTTEQVLSETETSQKETPAEKVENVTDTVETPVETAEVTEGEGQGQAEAEEVEQQKEDTGYGQIIGISMAELEEKMAAKESFFVYFATLQCPYCHEFHDMLVDYVQDHNITMYQVILDYEDKPEEENRAYIAELFKEFQTVPGVFLVLDGENGNYLDTYNLGVGEEVFHEWVEVWKEKVDS